MDITIPIPPVTIIYLKSKIIFHIIFRSLVHYIKIIIQSHVLILYTCDCMITKRLQANRNGIFL